MTAGVGGQHVQRRCRPTPSAVLLIGLLLSGCATGGSSTAGGPGGGPSTGPPGGPSAGGPSARAAEPQPGPVLDRPVVVDLAVEWRPESELTDEQVRAQRDRVARAEQEVLRDLGPHGRLRRQLHETAQTALLVDVEGRARLARHPRVAKARDDEAATSTAG